MIRRSFLKLLPAALVGIIARPRVQIQDSVSFTVSDWEWTPLPPGLDIDPIAFQWAKYLKEHAERQCGARDLV